MDNVYFVKYDVTVSYKVHILQWTVRLGFGDRGPPVLLLAVEGRKKGQGDIYPG